MKYTPELIAAAILGILYWLCPWYVPVAIVLAFAVAGRILTPYYRGSVTYKVPKGSHFILLRQRVLYWIYWIGAWKFHATEMNYWPKFHETKPYYIGKNQSDWNKLPGLQSGFDRRMRHLRAWRWYDAEWQAAYYSHVGSATPSYSDYPMLAPEHTYCSVVAPTWFKWVTPLFVYFGGNMPAQHDTYVTISGMEVR